MGEGFWIRLLYVLAQHVKTLPIPDFLKTIIVLAAIGVLISGLLALIAVLIESLRDKEETQNPPIKKTLPQRTGKASRERIILCSDQSCIGTIGDDGCCRYCGKPLTKLETTKALETRLDNQIKYQLINDNLQAILESIPRSHIGDYDYLIQNRNEVADLRYQQKYKTFYRLFGAGLSAFYCNEYFTLLRLNFNVITSLRDVASYLYEIPCNNRGKKLQFSFSSKLIHTVNPHSPIYDSNIARFYSFSEPKSTNTTYEQRILKLLTFHEWLCDEYERVLRNAILTQAIQQFRDRFKPITFTDEKVIDSLIWASEKWWKPEKGERHAKRQPASEEKSMDGMVKRVELRASQSAVETEVLKTLYAYEERVLRVRNNGRRVRAIRTWRMFDDHGIIPAIEIMMGTKKKHPGLVGLIEIGRQDLTFEALVLRHPESFSQEAGKLAKQRLEEAIRAHAIREKKHDDQSKLDKMK